MASSAPTQFESQVKQHLDTFKKYKTQITSGGLQSMTPEQIQSATGCSPEEAKAIAALWPVYSLGRQDSSSSGGSSNR